MTLPRRPLLKTILAHRRDLGLFAEAVVWLSLAIVAIRLLPFCRLAERLAPRVRRQRGDEQGTEACLRRVRWAINAAARRLPWRSVCFDQGIAAQRMLCRRGLRAELRYGVGKSAPGNPDALTAHVWVTVGNVTVVGGRTAASFAEIASFRPR